MYIYDKFCSFSKSACHKLNEKYSSSKSWIKTKIKLILHKITFWNKIKSFKDTDEIIKFTTKLLYFVFDLVI